MTNYELARLLEDLTLADCQNADGAPDHGFRDRLHAALVTSNIALGPKGLGEYEKHLQTNLVESNRFLRNELYEMREILLRTPFADELKCSGADRVPICFLLGGDPNASAFNAPDNNPVVQVEGALQNWLIFLNRLLIRCAEKGTDKMLRKQEFIKYARVWTEMLFGIRRPENVDDVSAKFTGTCAEPFGNIMSVKMTEWQQLWVLAHELAHISLGHLAECAAKAVDIGDGTHDLRYYQRSQEQEYQADIRATEYLFAVHDEVVAHPDVHAALYPDPFHGAAPFVVLMYFSYLEMLRWIPGQKWVCSHPMARDRARYLNEHFGERISSLPESHTLLHLTQEMILKVTFLIFDEHGLPRPESLPPDLDLNWGLGDRVD